MNTQMKILKQIAIKADLFREKTKSLGEIAEKAFSDKHKSQVKNLENIANSALKVSDVLDYVKRQTGRDKKWKTEGFGEKLLQETEVFLKQTRDNICGNLQITSDEQKLEVYLLLIREFIRQIVIHYEFSSG